MSHGFRNGPQVVDGELLQKVFSSRSMTLVFCSLALRPVCLFMQMALFIRILGWVN